MTIDEIKEIVQLLADSGVAEIEVQRGENRVWIKRTAYLSNNDLAAASHQALALPALAVPAPVNSGAAVPSPAVTPAAPPAPAAPAVEEKLSTITSPIVGTFYEAASPGAPPFVKPGDTIQPGQVLCIIESMKLMNEIEAEAPGVIVSKLVSNGKPVEYGEALFTYKPL